MPQNNELLKTVYKDLKQCRDRFVINRSLLPLGERLLTGVNFIDEPIGGLIDTEFFLIAASTGMGKTTIGANIAQSTTMQNKNVVYFALEAYEGEIEDRIKFSLLRAEVFARENKYLDFKKWYFGEYPQYLNYEEKIIERIDERVLNNLYVMYRKQKETYTAKKFADQVASILEFKKIDLILIDHLHYFDYETENISENNEQRKIVTHLRDVGLTHKIPIIVFAQLRKQDRKNKYLVPDLDEVMGSSDITKNVTCALTIAPAKNIEMSTPNSFPTFMYYAKNRFDGSLKRYLMETRFNNIQNQYSEKYRLYYLKGEGTDLAEVSVNMTPNWARNRIFSENFF